MRYDYLLVGAGLFNAVFAYKAVQHGKTCLVVEKRKHIGGNCYTEPVKGIMVHCYGAHIFRTDDEKVWDFIGQFTRFNHFINSPMANYRGEIYNLPFNMNTFSKMWGISSPAEAWDIIRKQAACIKGQPRNLEEHAISQVGTDIYEKLIKGYTEKQWGRPCRELPVSIMRRIPVRFIYDNNYYNVRYQGIPEEGYTHVMEKMFEGCDILLEKDFLEHRELKDKADRIIYTGTIDGYYGYCFGPLAYRSLRFETQWMDKGNRQGVAVMNYTDKETPYTRIIEHKHFMFGEGEGTVITEEYPVEWKKGMEEYYPINDEGNQKRYMRYQEKAKQETEVFFGGRLGTYSYTDMQDTVKLALGLWEQIGGDNA